MPLDRYELPALSVETLSSEGPLDQGAQAERPPAVFCRVSNRAMWKVFGALLVGSTLFAAGAERTPQRAAQLTLDWVDNSGGTATFIIERKTGPAGIYARIATTGIGITTYTDSALVAGTTYCYRVMASNAAGHSGYSNEACGAPVAGAM